MRRYGSEMQQELPDVDAFLDISDYSDAPRVFKVEQVPARLPSATPTVVRALIYDNEPWLVTAQQTYELVYRVDGGSPFTLPVKWMGGNLFRDVDADARARRAAVLAGLGASAAPR